MARPKKMGLDYYPVDVNLFEDIRIRKLIKYHSGKAIAVYLNLLGTIYKSGYYLKWDTDLPFVVSESTGFDEGYINDVINYCLEVGLFSNYWFKKSQVLTSKGIQERFKLICDQMKREYDFSNYDCVNPEETGVFTEETPVNPEETGINPVISTQRKGKEIKENEIKINESEGNEIIPPPIQEDSKIIFISKQPKQKKQQTGAGTTFANSVWFDREKFNADCPPDWSDWRKNLYYESAKNWSEENETGKGLKKNWINAVVKWNLKDNPQEPTQKTAPTHNGFNAHRKEDPIQTDTITLIIQKFNEYAEMDYDWKDVNIRGVVSDRLLQDASPNDIFDIIQLKSMEFGIGEKRQYLTLQSLLSNKNYANYLQQVKDIKDKKKQPNITFQQKTKMQNDAISRAIGQDITALYK